MGFEFPSSTPRLIQSGRGSLTLLCEAMKWVSGPEKWSSGVIYPPDGERDSLDFWPQSEAAAFNVHLNLCTAEISVQVKISHRFCVGHMSLHSSFYFPALSSDCVVCCDWMNEAQWRTISNGVFKAPEVVRKLRHTNIEHQAVKKTREKRSFHVQCDQLEFLKWNVTQSGIKCIEMCVLINLRGFVRLIVNSCRCTLV